MFTHEEKSNSPCHISNSENQSPIEKLERLSNILLSVREFIRSLSTEQMLFIICILILLIFLVFICKGAP